MVGPRTYCSFVQVRFNTFKKLYRGLFHYFSTLLRLVLFEQLFKPTDYGVVRFYSIVVLRFAKPVIVQ